MMNHAGRVAAMLTEGEGSGPGCNVKKLARVRSGKASSIMCNDNMLTIEGVFSPHVLTVIHQAGQLDGRAASAAPLNA